MSRLPALHRATTAACLVISALLAAVSVVTSPDLDGPSDLAAISAAGSTATLSALAFLWSQLPLAVGFLGVARALRDRHRVLSPLIATTVALAAFGHTVFGGMSIVTLAMADDAERPAAFTDVLDQAFATAIPFAILGVLGVVLTFILTGVAVLRGGLGPRWVGGLLIAFVVVEFGLSGFGWGGWLSAALVVVSSCGLAAATARTGLERWMTAGEAAMPQDLREAAPVAR
jgi:hypothetical protein